MPQRRSIFFEEWRKCLREHYKETIRNDDQITLKSLEKVLVSEAVRFSDDELRELYVEATMRADDVSDDFVPDMDKAIGKTKNTKDDRTFDVHPAECTCELCSPLDEVIDEMLEKGHDADGQPIPEET